MMTVDDMLAREHIRHLMATYNMAGDGGRKDEFSACFAEEAFLQTPDAQFSGRSAIVEGLFSAVGGLLDAGGKPKFRFARHHLSTCQITLTGPDTAKARSYFVVITDSGVDHSGVYTDEFCVEAGAWKIARRLVRVEYINPASVFF